MAALWTAEDLSGVATHFWDVQMFKVVLLALPDGVASGGLPPFPLLGALRPIPLEVGLIF